MYIEIDVDIDDIVDGMTKREKQELLDSLLWELEKSKPLPAKSNDDFDNALRILQGRGWQLTKAEEEFIIAVSKRF